MCQERNAAPTLGRDLRLPSNRSEAARANKTSSTGSPAACASASPVIRRAGVGNGPCAQLSNTSAVFSCKLSTFKEVTPAASCFAEGEVTNSAIELVGNVPEEDPPDEEEAAPEVEDNGINSGYLACAVASLHTATRLLSSSETSS